MVGSRDKIGAPVDSRLERVAFLLKELVGEPQLKRQEEEFVDQIENKFSDATTFNLAPWEYNKLEEIYKRLK